MIKITLKKIRGIEEIIKLLDENLEYIEYEVTGAKITCGKKQYSASHSN